jgi:flagellar basal-body rod modification protein FlgD
MATDITGISSASYGSTITNATSSNDEVSKDQFLRLLTYQLQAQNPLEPYDNQEFASQLAQFSQLELLSDIKSMLEQQIDTNLLLTQTVSNTALPGLLGKTAKAYSDSILFDGDSSSKMGYTLTQPASSATLKIYDEAGNTVYSRNLTGDELTSGDHTLDWDGTKADGSVVSYGNYSFEIKAYDADGTSYDADTFASGKITSVRFKSSGTFLVVNDSEVALNEVIDISSN